jgi:hypothetical protein
MTGKSNQAVLALPAIMSSKHAFKLRVSLPKLLSGSAQQPEGLLIL